MPRKVLLFNTLVSRLFDVIVFLNDPLKKFLYIIWQFLLDDQHEFPVIMIYSTRFVLNLK